MDISRGSSVYSTDANRKPTYLQYQSSVDDGSRPASYAAATDYTESLGPAPERTPPSSARGSTSRPPSRPSFMNYQNGAPAREQQSKAMAIPHVRNASTATAVPLDTRAGVSIGGGGMLLVFVGAALHGQTMQYLERLLQKRVYSGLTVIGTRGHEADVKGFKMEVYALIGQMGREMSVHTHVLTDMYEGDIVAGVKQAIRSGDEITGVLCCMSYDHGGPENADILSLDTSTLAQGWQRSSGYLHAVAKATIPSMLAAGRSEPSAFLVAEEVGSSPTSQINEASCGALLMQLKHIYASRQLTVDYADNVLVAEPEQTPTAGTGDSRPSGLAEDEYSFTPSESPTKLWNMWALQNEINGD